MRTTRHVLDNHLERFLAGDLPGILSDYAGDAILFTPQRQWRGPGEIRTFFEGLFAEFAKPGSRFAVDHLATEGDYGYLIWNGESGDNVYQMGTDTFVLRDGRIAVQTFAGTILPKG